MNICNAVNRRGFIFAAAATIAAPAWTGYEPYPPLKVKRIRVDVGAERPFKALQTSDVHIALCDARDGAEKLALYARRAQRFANARHYLDEAIVFARKEGAQLLSTGDMWDFLSIANVETAGRIFAADGWFACTGNHEYTEDLDGEKEDEAWKLRSLGRVREAYPNDPFFASKVINGVNFIALDDVYYQVSERSAELFEGEVRKGMPIVVLAHVPFYAPGLVAESMKQSKSSRMGQCGWVAGAPEEVVRTYGTEIRIRSQMPTKVTRDFRARLQAEPLVKAILAGHLHWSWEESFSATAMQYVCGGTFIGMVQLFEFV